MFCSRFFKTFALAVFFTAMCCHANNWKFDFKDLRFNIGAGIRNQTPIVAIGGIGYKDVILRVQGMGFHNGPNDYWCGIRGSLLWTFFRDLPFHFDTGIGGGYEFAEAPNKMHQALNKVNEKLLTYPYNYKEVGDISLELWTHLYGVYTQITVPAYRFLDHDAKRILWGAGYILEF